MTSRLHSLSLSLYAHKHTRTHKHKRRLQCPRRDFECSNTVEATVVIANTAYCCVCVGYGSSTYTPVLCPPSADPSPKSSAADASGIITLDLSNVDDSVTKMGLPYASISADVDIAMGVPVYVKLSAAAPGTWEPSSHLQVIVSVVNASASSLAPAVTATPAPSVAANVSSSAGANSTTRRRLMELQREDASAVAVHKADVTLTDGSNKKTSGSGGLQYAGREWDALSADTHTGALMNIRSVSLAQSASFMSEASATSASPSFPEAARRQFSPMREAVQWCVRSYICCVCMYVCMLVCMLILSHECFIHLCMPCLRAHGTHLTKLTRHDCTCLALR
jgi:hypothetical protein